MTIFIERLQKEDADKLLEFERENRIFFEETVPTRGDEYYMLEIFNNQLVALLDEQLRGVSQFYLIKGQDHNILGRINLVDFDKSRTVCHLGYRIGENHTGKGIASKALALLLENLINPNIRLIKAKTTTNNIASQKVLEKNGFVRGDISDEPFEMNGQKVSFIDYMWTKIV